VVSGSPGGCTAPADPFEHRPGVVVTGSRVRGPVEVAWGDGTQTDFYDQPEQVRFAIEAIDRRLTATMPVDEEVRA
jgi:hypothetical protein